MKVNKNGDLWWICSELVCLRPSANVGFISVVDWEKTLNLCVYVVRLIYSVGWWGWIQTVLLLITCQMRRINFFLFALCLVQVNPIDLLIHTREETSAPPLHLLTDYTTLVIFQHHIQLETTSLEGFFLFCWNISVWWMLGFPQCENASWFQLLLLLCMCIQGLTKRDLAMADR